MKKRDGKMLDRKGVCVCMCVYLLREREEKRLENLMSTFLKVILKFRFLIGLRDLYFNTRMSFKHTKD